MSTLEEVLEKVRTLRDDIVPTHDHLPEEFGFGPIYWEMRDAIIVCKVTGTIVLWNPAAELLLGWKSEEVCNVHTVDIIIPEHLKMAHHLGLTSYRETGTGRFITSKVPSRLPAVTKDGASITVEMLMRPVDGPDGTGYVMALLRDVTNLVEFEKKSLTPPLDPVILDNSTPIL